MRIRSRWMMWNAVWMAIVVVAGECGVGLSGGTARAQTMESPASEAAPPPVVHYDAVQPILREHCAACHNEDQPRADLVLTSLDKILAGSTSGPVVVPGQPQASPLYLLTAHLESPHMPPNKPKLPPRVLNKLSQWIETGLVLESAPSGAMPEPTQVESAQDSVSLAPLKLKPFRACVPGHRVRALAIHPLVPTMVFDGDEQVLLWDLNSDAPQSMAIETHGEEVTQLQFNHDGSQLWIASGVPADYGQLHVWDVANAICERSLGSESDTIQALAIAPDARWLAIGTTTSLLKLLEYPEGDSREPELTLNKHTDWVTATAISPDGYFVASGDRFGAILVWDPNARKEFAILRGHSRGITSIAWSFDGERLCTSSQDGTLRWWDLHRMESILAWPAHEGGVAAMVLMPTGQILSAGHDGALKCWSIQGLENGQPIVLWEQSLGSPAIALAMGNQGRSLAVSNVDGEILTGTWQQGIEASQKPELRTRNIPKQSRVRTLTAAAPKPPNRNRTKSIVEEKASNSIEQVTNQNGQAAVDTSKQSASDMDWDTLAASDPTLHRDLEDLRQTLRASEEALDRSYETTKQLEETVARLRSVLAVQEARAKQVQLELRRIRTLPKTP